MTITELLESWKGHAEKAEAELARVQRELDHKKMWANEIAACAKEELEKAHREIERVQLERDHYKHKVERCREVLSAQTNESICEAAERVKAAAVEMREILEKTRHYNLGTPEGIPNEWFIRRDKVLSSTAGTGYVRKEDVRPLLAVIENAVKNCFFCRGTGAISKAADRMSADPPPLPHECRDCKPLREALAHAKAKGLV